ncbi:MAG: hypothetical protein Q9N02_02300 [Ghiorsea sp.]|nr:hypothetical protein [Ghiorsea sp.]
MMKMKAFSTIEKRFMKWGKNSGPNAGQETQETGVGQTMFGLTLKIKHFRKLNHDSHILLMRVPQGIKGGTPLAADGLEIYDWNMDMLDQFIKR